MRTGLIKLFLYSCAFLPLPLLHTLGAGTGWLLTLVPNRLRAITRINLERCFPELAAPGGDACFAAQPVANPGKTLLETGALWLRPAQQILDLVHEGRGTGRRRAG
ncbi:MAG: hypothetical protein R3F42_04300 [Pseudomonadota bacterium]